MLKREQRLRKGREINRVYSRGRFGGSSDLQVKALKTNWPKSRIAIVVSKKVAKKAVTRNRIKRRLSPQLAKVWETVLPGYDIVVSVRQDISDSSSPSLQKQLTTALSRSGVLVSNQDKNQGTNANNQKS